VEAIQAHRKGIQLAQKRATYATNKDTSKDILLAIQTIQQSNGQILEAIRTTHSQSSSLSLWTPIIQGVITGVARAFGANVTFSQSPVHRDAGT
jgi:hypothetical protein